MSESKYHGYNFEELLEFAKDTEKKMIDSKISFSLLDSDRRQKIDAFMEEYTGEEGDSLKLLYKKFDVTNNDIEFLEPIIQASNNWNELYHMEMDMNLDNYIRLEKEKIKNARDYIKSNKYRMSKITYKSMMRYIRKRQIENIKESISFKIEKFLN